MITILLINEKTWTIEKKENIDCGIPTKKKILFFKQKFFNDNLSIIFDWHVIKIIKKY